MLKRTLFKEELEPNWPGPDKVGTIHSVAVDRTVECYSGCLRAASCCYHALIPWQLWDWDMWMRLDVIRKHRSAASHFFC